MDFKSEKNKKKLAGFTLIELLVYVAILSIMSVVVADSFLSLNAGRANLEAKSEVNANCNFVLEKIQRDIASASALNTPAIAGASANTLNLNIASSSVIYAVVGGQVTRQVDMNNPEYLSAPDVMINSLSFLRLENVNPVLNKKRINVQISISASYNSSSSNWQYSQTQTGAADLNGDF